MSIEATDGRHRLRILLAEDNAVNQLLARALLQKRGHEVILAKTGKEVLTALEQRQFNAVLMDVQMPEMDGFEATAAIRAHEANGKSFTPKSGLRLPIIAMTGEALEGDRERCLKAGMDDYLTKPIQPDEMFRAIENLSAAAGTPVEQHAAAVNRASLDAMVRSKPERLRKLIEVFINESTQLVSEIRSAVSSADAARLRRAAHSLKGAVAIFGAPAATAAAQRLESLGESGSMTDAVAAFQTLETELERLRPRLLEASATYLPPTA